MKTLEEQLIDNENRVALMAAIIAAGICANSNNSGTLDGAKTARQSIALAKYITKEVGVEAEKVRSEL